MSPTMNPQLNLGRIEFEREVIHPLVRAIESLRDGRVTSVQIHPGHHEVRIEGQIQLRDREAGSIREVPISITVTCRDEIVSCIARDASADIARGGASSPTNLWQELQGHYAPEMGPQVAELSEVDREIIEYFSPRFTESLVKHFRKARNAAIAAGQE